MIFFDFVIKTSMIKTIQILHVTDTVIEITTKNILMLKINSRSQFNSSLSLSL